jgi:hypothetical protein
MMMKNKVNLTQHKLTHIYDVYIQGFILVYSITDDATFEGLKKIRQEILSVHPNPKV